MKFPILYADDAEKRNEEHFPISGNRAIQRRMMECLFHVTKAILVRFKKYSRGDNVKLKEITIYDGHNEYNDFYAICVGVSKNRDEVDRVNYFVPSDTLEMRLVLKTLFEKYSGVELRECKERETAFDGIQLNITEKSRAFLRDLYHYWQIVYDQIKDEPFIDDCCDMNKYGIPVEAVKTLMSELEELKNRFF